MTDREARKLRRKLKRIPMEFRLNKDNDLIAWGKSHNGTFYVFTHFDFLEAYKKNMTIDQRIENVIDNLMDGLNGII